VIVVYTNGCWDLFHVGHLRLLERAKLEGDFLIVGVNTDEWMLKFKHVPTIPWEQRAEIIGSLKCVDRVVPHSGIPTFETLQEYGVDKIIIGSTWYDSSCGTVKCFEHLIERGIEFGILEATPNVSTSQIRETIRKGDKDA